MQNDVVIKFCCPSGAPTSVPSKTMTDALRQLSESAELKPLITGARNRGRKLVVQVFQHRDGHPFLIHLAAVDQTTA